MNTRILMMASAFFLGALGISFTFLPEEILQYLHIAENQLLALLLQVLGALYLGFAMLNWMTKNSIIGGIYGRPLIVSNFLHFGVSAIALLKVVFKSEHVSLVWTWTILYTILAVAFAYVWFANPQKQKIA